ncbi:hypothetical protein VNI00_016123 [Paramarasmius palmivorus]|uniref:Uncharacterized protein n=1 Tax=Paramarasmius palmivorus TaxID=297713 RepID=A0AAW0BDU0_9AGAR
MKRSRSSDGSALVSSEPTKKIRLVSPPLIPYSIDSSADLLMDAVEQPDSEEIEELLFTNEDDHHESEYISNRALAGLNTSFMVFNASATGHMLKLRNTRFQRSVQVIVFSEPKFANNIPRIAIRQMGVLVPSLLIPVNEGQLIEALAQWVVSGSHSYVGDAGGLRLCFSAKEFERFRSAAYPSYTHMY